jgi:putative endonuclease
MNRAAAEARGRRAERRAAWWLRLHGWRIVGRRQRVPVGEVDQVARRGRPKAVVEV